MDDSKQNDGSHLFLVRLWQDPSDGDQASWQGKVQHVITGKADSFADWPSLVTFLTSNVSRSHLFNSASLNDLQRKDVMDE